MRRILTVAALAMMSGTIGLRADDKTATRWFSHVEALANDGMEGRNTGSPGHKRAAEYVTAQFKKSGLEPAGVGEPPSPSSSATTRTSTCASILHRRSTRRSYSSATACTSPSAASTTSPV